MIRHAKVTLYSGDGHEVKNWLAWNVEIDPGGICKFVDKYPEKQIVVSGNVTVEEIVPEEE